ncbi:MAG: metallophosphoesterase [Desulfovibrio sp.]|jgi:predicted MPP superfamily phosphohydrolase|nr:metallophosphoesterase [Desulfovibrio sp.]
MSMLHIVGGLVFFYLLFRLILPLPASCPVKIAAALALLLATQQHVLARAFFGGLSSPELPRPVLIVQSLLLVSSLFLFLLVLLRDAAALLPRAARRIAGRSGERGGGGFSPGRRIFLGTCLAVIPAAYGIRGGITVPQVRATQSSLPRLPAELDGLRIAHISDLHIGPLLLQKWTEAVVDTVNGLEPDLIVVTGDIVDGLPSRRAESVAPLKKLRARHGVFACAGNHEYYSNFRAWMRAFSALDMDMLLNERRVLNIGGRQLIMAGVTDIAAARFGLPLPDRDAALDGAPEDAVRILLAHRPSDAADNAASGVDLQLSGHTHGGQILGLRRIVAEFNEGYLYGWYQVQGMRLYVGSGAGLWNGFPVRLGVPSEIAHITLRCDGV